MGLHDDVVKIFTRTEELRVDDWQDWPERGPKLRRAIREAFPSRVDLPDGDLEFRAPVEIKLDVTYAWHVSGVVVELGDLEVYARYLTGETVDADRVEVFPVGSCRRCQGKVPLEVEAEDEVRMGAALLAGRPGGHDCSMA